MFISEKKKKNTLKWSTSVKYLSNNVIQNIMYLTVLKENWRKKHYFNWNEELK